MSEAWHRRWLHAIEDDTTVPGTPMQIARIYADYAASKGGRWAHVSYPELIRQTHRGRCAIGEAIAYLAGKGWLTLRGDWRCGQEKSYELTIPGQEKKRTAQQTGMRGGTVLKNRTAQRDGTVPPSGPVCSAGRRRTAQRDGSVPPSGTRTSYVFYVSLCAAVDERAAGGAGGAGAGCHGERDRGSQAADRPPPRRGVGGRGDAGRDRRRERPGAREAGPGGGGRRGAGRSGPDDPGVPGGAAPVAARRSQVHVLVQLHLPCLTTQFQPADNR